MGELLSKQLSPEELPPPAELPLGLLTRLSPSRVLSSRAAYVSPSSSLLFVCGLGESAFFRRWRAGWRWHFESHVFLGRRAFRI